MLGLNEMEIPLVDRNVIFNPPLRLVLRPVLSVRALQERFPGGSCVVQLLRTQSIHDRTLLTPQFSQTLPPFAPPFFPTASGTLSCSNVVRFIAFAPGPNIFFYFLPV